MMTSSIFFCSRFAILLDLGGVRKKTVGQAIMYGSLADSRAHELMRGKMRADCSLSKGLASLYGRT